MSLPPGVDFEVRAAAIAYVTAAQIGEEFAADLFVKLMVELPNGSKHLLTTLVKIMNRVYQCQGGSGMQALALLMAEQHYLFG